MIKNKLQKIFIYILFELLFLVPINANQLYTNTLFNFTGGGILTGNSVNYNSSIFSNQGIVSDSQIFYYNSSKKYIAGYASMIEIDNPDIPILVNPKNNEDTYINEITFFWKNTLDTWSGVEKYIFQLSKSDSFNEIIWNEETTDTYITEYFDTLIDTYYWRIIAVDQYKNTSVSEIRKLTTYIPSNLTPKAIITLNDTGIFIGQNIRVLGENSYDSDGNIIEYKWFYNGTEISNDSNFNITFSQAGHNSIILKVRDNSGVIDTQEIKFFILLPNIHLEQNVSGVRPNNNFYTIAFEDLYPQIGDGDYNDFVTNLQITQTFDSNNNLSKILIKSKALARGAGYDHTFKIKVRFNGNAEICRYMYDSFGRNYSYQKINSNNGATISIFDSTKAAFNNQNMPNVQKNQTYTEGHSAVIEIKILNPLINPYSSSDVSPYDPFLYVVNTGREIYLNTIDNAGYPYAIIVPSSWKWPFEGNQIDSDVKKPATNVAYPLFRDWRQTVYNSKINWYDFPNINNVYPNNISSRNNNKTLNDTNLAYLGDIITLNIKVKNNTNKNVNNLLLSNILPKGLSLISSSDYPKADTIIYTDSLTMNWQITNIGGDSEINYYYEAIVTTETIYIGKKLNITCDLKNNNNKISEDTLTEIFIITDYPSTVNNFQGKDYGQGNILLSFEKSVTPNASYYKIYWDSGTGIINYDSPISVLTADTKLLYDIYYNNLKTEMYYKFAVRVTDDKGIEEKNISMVVSIKSENITGAISPLHAYIKHPQPGQKISGNSVNIMAEISNSDETTFFETNRETAKLIKNKFTFTHNGNPLDYIETTVLNNVLTVNVYTKEIEPSRAVSKRLIIYKPNYTTEYELIYNGTKTGFYHYSYTVPNFSENVDSIYVTMVCEGKKLKSDNVKSILFQMKENGTENWQNVTPTIINNNSTNPDFNNPYFVITDFSNFADGNYDLRAVLTDVENRIDANPPYITVEINNTNADVKKRLTSDNLPVVNEIIDISKNNEISISKFTNTGTENDFSAILNIPVNSIDTNTSIIMEVIKSDTDIAKEILGKTDKAKASDILEIIFTDSPVRISDTQPLELTVHYNDLDNNNIIDGTAINVDDVSLWTYSKNTGVLEELETKKNDTENKEITAKVKHFSYFVLLGKSLSNVSRAVGLYPNPFVPYDNNADNGMPFSEGIQNSGIIFSGLSKNSSLKIYTIDGTKVLDRFLNNVSDKVQWDVKNDSGRELSSGVYIYVIYCENFKKTGKLVIIR